MNGDITSHKILKKRKGPPVSVVVYAAAGRWAQHRSSGAVVTV